MKTEVMISFAQLQDFRAGSHMTLWKVDVYHQHSSVWRGLNQERPDGSRFLLVKPSLTDESQLQKSINDEVSASLLCISSTSDVWSRSHSDNETCTRTENCFQNPFNSGFRSNLKRLIKTGVQMRCFRIKRHILEKLVRKNKPREGREQPKTCDCFKVWDIFLCFSSRNASIRLSFGSTWYINKAL